jgi:hypothetical protein
MFMVDPKDIIRTDGTKVTVPLHPSWKTQFYGLYLTLKTDPMIMLLFPMFFSANWFYTWREFPLAVMYRPVSPYLVEFNDYNGFLFTLRGRSLNEFLYWTSQIMGSIAISFLLDSKLERRARAFASWTVLLAMVFLTHIWAYFYQRYVSSAISYTPSLTFQ